MIEVKEKDGIEYDVKSVEGGPDLTIEARPKMCDMCDSCKIKKGVMDKDSLIFDDDVDIHRRYAYLLYKYTTLLKDYVDLLQEHQQTLKDNNESLKKACRMLGLEDDGK